VDGIAPVDDAAPAGRRVQPECLWRWVGVQQARRHAVRAGGVEGIQRRCDGWPQPGPQRKVVRVRVDPVETLDRCDLVARQGPVHPGQRPADQILLGVVLARERPARHPGQQGQPGTTDINDEFPADSGHRRPGGYARLLQPARYDHAPGERTAVIRGHRLGHPPPVTKIDEPGVGAHAPVMHADPGTRQAPVLAQARDQR
jgi:hypothetical protein